MWLRARGPLAGALALAICLASLSILSGGDETDASGQGQAALSPDFLGLVAEDVFGKPGRYRRRNLDRLEQTGAGLVRQTFDWARIERRHREQRRGPSQGAHERLERHEQRRAHGQRPLSHSAGHSPSIVI